MDNLVGFLPQSDLGNLAKTSKRNLTLAKGEFFTRFFKVVLTSGFEDMPIHYCTINFKEVDAKPPYIITTALYNNRGAKVYEYNISFTIMVVKRYEKTIDLFCRFNQNSINIIFFTEDGINYITININNKFTIKLLDNISLSKSFFKSILNVDFMNSFKHRGSIGIEENLKYYLTEWVKN